MKYICTYDNDYCGGVEWFFIEADNIDTVYAFLEEGLYDWAENQCLGVQGYNFDTGFESEEDEEYYYENCTYSAEEVTDEEFYAKLEEEGYEETDIIKI